MKRVVFFCDAQEGGRSQGETNVYRMFAALQRDPGQAAFYDDGGGTETSPPETSNTGSDSERFFRNVKSGYGAIARLYERGDDVFLFGAGRGAHIVRYIAGMIATCGLPTRGFDDVAIASIFQAYRNPDRRRAILVNLARHAMFGAKIRMLGVWGNVGTRGIPSFVGNVDPLTAGFLDTNLHPNVLNAYQAFAIDERRRELFPAQLPAPPAAGQVIEQAWFAGVLHDVVGGYADTDPGMGRRTGKGAGRGAKLPDVTLEWMMNKAESHGLKWKAQEPARSSLDIGKALPVLHKARKLFYCHPAGRAFLRRS